MSRPDPTPADPSPFGAPSGFGAGPGPAGGPYGAGGPSAAAGPGPAGGPNAAAGPGPAGGPYGAGGRSPRPGADRSGRASRFAGGAAGMAGRGSAATRRVLERTLGGPERTRIIVVLAAILALSSADSSTVGASATELRQALHIGNADVGLLVAVSAGVGALASVPFGILVDRFPRLLLLRITLLFWGAAMVASAMVNSFQALLLVRLFLGFVTAVAGPAVASLVGDYFPGEERGKIYGYVLAGELLGAGVGFSVTGDVAALSWRAAFLLLSVPAFLLIWQMRRMHEPVRGGGGYLLATGGQPAPGDPAVAVDSGAGPEAAQPQITEVQKTALSRGLRPDPDLVLRQDPQRMNIWAVFRYVIRVRTNVVLIVSSACAYFFMTGVQTFGLEFVHTQYGVNTVLANLLLLVVGAGAVLGVLIGGVLGDSLVRSGRISGRMLVAGIAATGTALLFGPALLTHGPMSALPYITGAAFCLTAQNPTLDAARLDIMPPLLWGRAEGIRTLLRAGSQSVAPIVFGGLSDLLAGTHQGLRLTFAIMLLPLLASGLILLRGLRYYPTDVATAAASTAGLPTTRTGAYPDRTGPGPASAPAPPYPAPPYPEPPHPEPGWGAAPPAWGTPPA